MRPRAVVVALAAATLALGPVATADAVVAGRAASGPYPFIASLQLDDAHLCGASLIASRWVLTAGHCVDVARQSPGRLTVRVGSLDRTRGGSVAGVAEMIVHPGFDYGDPSAGPASVLHDLGLIRLDRAVPQRPIRVGAAGDGLTRTLGWGCTHDHTEQRPCDPATYPVRLRELGTRVEPDSRCTDLTPGRDLCVAPAAGRGQACAGDSGGPLVRWAHGGWLLVGVTSRPGLTTSSPCPGTVVAYTNVTAYREWVRAVTGR